MILRAAALLGLSLLLPTAVSAGETEPQRVVSLNLCADQLLVRLLPRGRIAGLTWLAADPLSSNVAAAAHGLPATGGSAEEVLRLDPDLVVAGRYTTRQTVRFLQRAGRRVLELDVPQTFAEARAQILDLADQLGVSERGGELVAEMEVVLPSLAEGTRPLRALIIGAYGAAAAPGSILDEVITRAGFVNLAADLIPAGGALSLEEALLARPDLLILDAEPRGPALASDVLDHPVFRKLKGRIAVVSLPSRLWTCAGPQLAEAVAMLRRSGDELRGQGPARPPDAF